VVPEVDHYVKNVPTILVGTKCDLRDAKQPDPSTGEFNPVSDEDAQKLADEIKCEKYISVSAKKGTNLKELFQEATKYALAVRQQAEGSQSPKASKSDASSSKDESSAAPAVVVKTKATTKKRDKGGCVLL